MAIKNKTLVEVDLTSQLQNLDLDVIRGDSVVIIDDLIKELTHIKQNGFKELTIRTEVDDNWIHEVEITALRPENKDEKKRRLLAEKNLKIKKAKEAVKLKEIEYNQFLKLKKKFEPS